MAANTQAKLLRILEERSFERVGGSESIAADVRILAATNQNLETLIEQGKFRKASATCTAARSNISTACSCPAPCSNPPATRPAPVKSSA